MIASAHVDTFARRHLPPRTQWPEFIFETAELTYAERINCATTLLDDAVAEGDGGRIAIRSDGGDWTYADLLEHANQIARVLTDDHGLVPGNRVLLHAPNHRLLVASWYATLKAGGIAVTTMPLLRRKELAAIAQKAAIAHAICDHRLAPEVREAATKTGALGTILTFGDGELEGRMRAKEGRFSNCETASDDVALLAFTSGTTGEPKATMHFHRDVLAIADVVGRHLLETRPDDIHIGTSPLGFTFGLGALIVLPHRFRAGSVLIARFSPALLLEQIALRSPTVLFTAPTMYRALLPLVCSTDIASLRLCVSAGEPLAKAISDAWFEKTGMRIVDGLGSTEMLHIFISARGKSIRPGATGKPLPGYRACILSDDNEPLPAGHTGRLAAKGPTGCRYLDDPRQVEYVIGGWNVTGDICRLDEDGYYWFQARADDLIISAGYNIAAPEVEAVLLEHPAVAECAAVGAPDPERGNIVKAFVVLRPGIAGNEALTTDLQSFVKQEIAPYKYPRAIEYIAALPKTHTGKVQRSKLRELELQRATVGWPAAPESEDWAAGSRREGKGTARDHE